MELAYTPKACSAEGSHITGMVVLNTPTILEKYELCEALGINVDDSGNVDLGKLGKISLLKQLIISSQKHYKQIKLVKKDGSKVESWDDLIADPDCEPVVLEVATSLLNGFRPSGN